jgi:aminopeptidase N
VPALTETEARARAALIAVDSYDVFIDLNPEAAASVRSRTEIRFTCAEPGAATFAELTATAVSAVLNGREVLGLDAPAGGRLALAGLAAENTLVVEAEVAADALTRFTDPADGAGYLLFTGYPTESPRLFCCFDQADLTATTTLSLVLPAGWECLANGPVTSRPAAGETGRWRFGPVDGTRPFDMTIAAGPYARAWSGTGGTGDAVRMSIWCRGSLAGTVPGPKGFERFAEQARQALAYYERMLGVPVPQVRHRVRPPAGRAGDLDPRADAGQREPAGPDGRPGRRLRGDALRTRGVAPVVRLPHLGPLVGRPVAGRGDGHVRELHGHGGGGDGRPVDRVLLPGGAARLRGRRAA